MRQATRRRFLRTMVGAGAVLRARAQIPGERPEPAPEIEVLNPRGRVPLSFIIDDSTCLVNLNKFSIPQFAAAFDNRRYHYDWRSMPNEIPDDFVRVFGNWCGENGVKGKYSIVPFPACVGRLDRELPGWAPRELQSSIDLVRSLMTPNWDIHPEMVTHTRVIDTKTGQPYPERSLRYMENFEWTDGRSVDELADYMRYALRILHNIGLPCEGITTPGGFGLRVLPELAQATLEACRDVYQAEIPHYFRHSLASGDASVAPRVEYAAGLNGGDPRCVVSIIGCTKDWTGGWDAAGTPEPDRFITRDLDSGRLVEVIERGEPACLVCHWTGIYHNGRELGFKAFQEVVRRLSDRYGHLLWMKTGEIARYWAAKELTTIRRGSAGVLFTAPFACPAFTVAFDSPGRKPPRLEVDSQESPLRETTGRLDLGPGAWRREGERVTVCFDLPKGASRLIL